MQNNTFSTLFIGQNLIQLSSVDSTNNYLKQLLSKSEPLAEGTVIMADDQYAGRGQHGNQWLSKCGLNLTFSIYLKPAFLPLQSQFLLNMAVSIGLHNALSHYISKGVKVKWPNDIYFEDEKIGGVLIENTIIGQGFKSTIIGIGINVNQVEFTEISDRRVSSLRKILHQDVDLKSLLVRICQAIEAEYLKLKDGTDSFLRKQYEASLYQYGKMARYRKDTEEFTGKILGVNDIGQIIIDIDGSEHKFGFKEIEFLR